VLLAAAVCPHPPLLVPEVAAGAADETADLRAACRAAVATLAPYETVVVGGSAQALDVGAWLLPGARAEVVADDAVGYGASLVAGDGLALLVMGDASARRSQAAPGYYDPRAEAYDAAVATALRDADPEALLALDPALSRELLVAGLPAWRALAGAARGGSWRGAVTYDAAPYGVGYVVATWSRA
jgi:aromatic ring-opening dioxygenase LigB subunit